MSASPRVADGSVSPPHKIKTCVNNVETCDGYYSCDSCNGRLDELNVPERDSPCAEVMPVERDEQSGVDGGDH